MIENTPSIPLETTSQTKASSDKHPHKSTQKKNKWLYCLGFISSFILLLAALLGWQQLQIRHHQKMVSLQLATMQQQALDTRQAVNRLQSTYPGQLQQQQMQIQLLEENLKKIVISNPLEKQDWQLLQVQYYLELAQINLHWSNDSRIALALLQAADNHLKSMNDQRIFSLRQVIAQEIIQLKLIPLLDRAGILSRLDAAQTVVDQLPLHFTYTKEQTPPGSWKNKWQENIHLLERLITIKHNNEALKTSIQQRLYSRENLHMHILAAQWALIQNDNTLYQEALSKALMFLDTHFNKSPLIDVLHKHLQELKQYSLTPTSSNLQQSLLLLEKLIQEEKPGKPGDRL